jgi:hypothetical protein
MYCFFTSVSNLCSLCLGDIDASCLFAFSYIQVFFYILGGHQFLR